MGYPDKVVEKNNFIYFTRKTSTFSVRDFCPSFFIFQSIVTTDADEDLTNTVNTGVVGHPDPVLVWVGGMFLFFSYCDTHFLTCPLFVSLVLAQGANNQMNV